MKHCFKYLWVALLSMLSVESGATYVFDPSGALGDSAAVLERQLQHYDATTGHRIVVAILESQVGDYKFEAWANASAQKLGLASADGERSVYVVMRKGIDHQHPKTWIVPGKQMADNFPRMFCKHVGSDQISGPVKDGFSYMHGITNGLPYIKDVMEGKTTADDYEAVRRGSAWKWFIVAGALLVLIAVVARKFR